MDERGMTLASSNWNQPDSFVGGSLSARNRGEGGAEFFINLPTPPAGD